MASQNSHPDWNSFGRAVASQQWRQQSAFMGKEATLKLVAAAAPRPGMDILDVACGTGEPAISLATALENTGKVVATDISAQPLNIGRERATQHGLANIAFQQADAQSLPFPDSSFDLITSRLGLMFIPKVELAIAEFHRLLRENGRVAFLCWGPMEQPYFTATIGTILRLFPQLEIPPAARAMFKFGKPGVLAEMLSRAGFRDVHENFQTFPWTWLGTPEQVWEYFQQVTAPFRPVMDYGTQEQRAERDRAVIAAISNYYDGKQIAFTAAMNITTARK